MTTVYKFKAGFTKLGTATAPSSAPTITIVDSSDNILASAQATTALSNLTGAYLYSYSGADGLDLVAKFTTTDLTMDAQELFATPQIAPSDIWSYATRTITSGGITVAEIWDALLSSITTSSSIGKLIKDYLDVAVSTRSTPASPVASTAALVSGTTITVLRGDTITLIFAGLGSLANISKLYFTAKQFDDFADTDAVIQIEKTAGLLRINKAAAVTAANGVLTVTDANAGDVTITLAAVEAAKLEVYTYKYDIEIVRSSGTPVSTLTSGNLIISPDITKAVT